ncbi:MAG: AMP-dependent synthetase/ligase [Pseudobdellovibrio sp.]
MTTIGHWILDANTRDNSYAVEYKSGSQWQSLTWGEYIQKVVAVYDFLKKQNIDKEAHIGLVSSTRWEWAVLDLAILGSLNISVPMYPNLSDEDLLYTINHSDVKVVVIENETLLKQIERIKEGFEREIKIFQLSDINFNATVSDETRDEFFKRCDSIDLKKPATIIYTSGTTGKPKGVVLLHEAISSEVIDGFALFNVKKDYKSLTFLPYAHVLGRLEHWGSCYNGHCIAYAESIDRLKSNLKLIKPDFLIAVPRIFEKVYAGIMAQVETNKLKQKLFSEALEAALEVEKYRRTKSSIPWGLLLKYEALNKLAFSPIRDAFGGNLKFAISGGAPIDPQLTEFFYNCGLPILQGYGLSETTGAITINTFSNYLIGSVGQPMGDVKIKIAADGEILVKSKKCMSEYYKNPEETAKVMQDGYFATGDIGEFTTGGFLKITDRKKDLIKTAGGKYVAPQKLEGLLKQEPLISQVLIIGDQKKYIIALITVDEFQIQSWAKSNNIAFEKVEELYGNLALKMRIQKHVQNCNTQLASYEAIKKFEILRDSWTIENGGLTQSLKVKRKFLEQKYADLIHEIYE